MDEWENVVTIRGTENNMQFGSVSMNSDGTVISISAPNDMDYGSVTVYKETNGIWNLFGTKITTEINSNFGVCTKISSDGNTVVIGSVGLAENQNGHVKIYNHDGINWVIKGTRIQGDDIDYFGNSISINEDVTLIAIGTKNGYGDSETIQDIGYVKTYQYTETDDDGNGECVQYGTTICGESSGSLFGNVVSMSKDGSILAINETGYQIGKGRISLYRNDSINNEWTIINDNIYTGSVNYQNLGHDIAINYDGGILVAVSINNVGINDNGYVTVYNIEPEPVEQNQ